MGYNNWHICGSSGSSESESDEDAYKCEECHEDKWKCVCDDEYCQDGDCCCCDYRHSECCARIYKDVLGSDVDCDEASYDQGQVC